MQSRKILIVEDEEVIRKVLRLTLTKWGFQVDEAEDGVQALRKLEQEKYCLLISDIMMPNMNGWELIREVKRNPNTQDIRIIALTVKNKDSDMFKGYELGADYYMTKPFTKAQLQYGIQLALGKPSDAVNECDLSEQFNCDES
jgi:two-component system alkaline phosphatase synthesis response regulator PhoP